MRLCQSTNSLKSNQVLRPALRLLLNAAHTSEDVAMEATEVSEDVEDSTEDGEVAAEEDAEDVASEEASAAEAAVVAAEAADPDISGDHFD